jgi:Xaa-Pro aminopeptidase
MTVRATDGPAAVLTAHEARQARLARVRQEMQRLGVDALLLSHGADLPWLTGYRAMPLERLTVLVVPADGQAVLVVPALEAPRLPDPQGLFDVRPWQETEDPVAVANALLAPRGAPVYAISDRAWAHSLLALQARLPAARWMPASSVTSSLRAVKDVAEIGALRAAAQAADVVAMALQGGDIPLEGRTERAVSDEIGERLLAAGHRRVNFAIVGSGPNGASPHHEAGDRRIAAGDSVVCDFGGEYPFDGAVGYCSDITRTVTVGEPSPEVQDCYAVLSEAHRSAVAIIRPGVTAEAVDAVARETIAEAGLGQHFIHRTGHGIGIEEHEDPYLVAGNDTALVPGHVFSVEPGIYLPGRFGMRLEDIVVVRADGAEALNTVDHSLVVVA